jgi:hypothetical protein
MLDAESDGAEGAVINALSSIGGDGVSEALERKLQIADTAWLKYTIASALVSLNHPTGRQVFLSAARDQDLEFVIIAYRYYIREGIEEAIPSLIEALNQRTNAFTGRVIGLHYAFCGNFLLEQAGRKYLLENLAIDNPRPAKEPPVWRSSTDASRESDSASCE